MLIDILHLEDSADDAELVRRALERGGLECRIDAVGTGPDYLAALEGRRYDVILSDSGIPGYDGRAALTDAHERHPRVPFIVVSGYLQREAASAAANGTPYSQVSKSDLHSLAAVVRASLVDVPTEDAPDDPSSTLRGMEHLIGVIQELSLARTLPAVMSIVRLAARHLVGADGATFILRDGEHCFYADESAIAPLWKGQRFPLGSCISGWTMLHRQAAVIPDIERDERIPLDAYRPTFVKSLVMTPIRTANPVGAIGVYWKTIRRPNEAQVALLRALADSTSVALESVELLEHLERRVAARTAELEALNRELEAFSYSVAHDLRAPLNSINGFSQLLSETNRERLEPAALGYLQRISGGVTRMHGLIDDLMGLSKIARAPLNAVDADLALLAHEILRAFTESDPQRKVDFVVTAAPAYGDAGLMRLLLENLLSNAWKFTSKVATARIEFGSTQNGAGRVYYVRDNGAGFDPRYSASLFSPFRRMHSDSEFPGTGIGLATVQRIVHRHGGTISAEAAVDRGACFRFTLANKPYTA